MVAGLPGTGKSTLARDLAARADFTVIRSDVVRKELAGPAAADSASSALGDGIYSAEWTDRTYAECLRRVERLLFEGTRVVVDATFGDEHRRRAFLDAAARRAVPGVLFVCEADPGTVRRRLESRIGDASDASWPVYLDVAKRWEPIGAATRPVAATVATSGSANATLAAALSVLCAHGLF